MKKAVIVVAFLMSAVWSLAVEPGVETASIFSVEGNVSVIPKGSNLAVEAKKGMVLHEGDWIKTDQSSGVVVSFNDDDSNVISVKENTLVIIKLDGYFKIHLLSGEIYAFLENVDKDESFRVLMPSVVAESMGSGWGATTDGSYTNLLVFDNEAFVCGIKMDGSIDDKKFWIDEGFQRRTIKFQDPGEMRPVPEEVSKWFKEQVVAHHLERSLARELKKRPGAANGEEEKMKKSGKPGSDEAKNTEGADNDGKTRSSGISKHTPGVFVVDGEELNLVEYLYRERLRQKPSADSSNAR